MSLVNYSSSDSDSEKVVKKSKLNMTSSENIVKKSKLNMTSSENIVKKSKLNMTSSEKVVKKSKLNMTSSENIVKKSKYHINLSEKRKKLFTIPEQKSDSDDDDNNYNKQERIQKVTKNKSTLLLSILPTPVDSVCDSIKPNNNIKSNKTHIHQTTIGLIPNKMLIDKEEEISDNFIQNNNEQKIQSEEYNQNYINPTYSNTNWNEIVNKTAGVKRKNIDISKLEILDINDDYIMGDLNQINRNLSNIEPPKFTQNIAKPNNIEKNKHKITYLAYQAKQQEIQKDTWAWKNYQPKKPTNRDRYGF